MFWRKEVGKFYPRRVLNEAGKLARPGVTTEEIDIMVTWGMEPVTGT